MKIKEAIEILKQMNLNDEVYLDFKSRSFSEKRDAYGRTQEETEKFRGQ